MTPKYFLRGGDTTDKNAKGKSNFREGRAAKKTGGRK